MPHFTVKAPWVGAALSLLWACSKGPSADGVSGIDAEGPVPSVLGSQSHTATRWTGSESELVEQVVAKADLTDNATVVHETGPALLDRARMEVRAAVEHSSAVVVGTVVDRDVETCSVPPHGDNGGYLTKGTSVHVDAIVKGDVPDLVYMDNLIHPSQPESYVFRYYTTFQSGRQYVFFLVLEPQAKGCSLPVYDRLLSGPLKEGNRGESKR